MQSRRHAHIKMAGIFFCRKLMVVVWIFVWPSMMNSSSFSSFQLVPNSTDYKCRDSNIISQTTLDGVISCLAQCTKISSCLSVFYKTSPGACVLCKDQSMVVADQSEDIGFVSYHKQLYDSIGQNCSVEECKEPTTICYSTTLTCLCRSSQQYSVSSRECVRECESPNALFYKYASSLPDRKSLFDIYNSSLSECQSECVNSLNLTKVCNGLAFSPSDGHCLLYHKISTLLRNTTDTYIRGCA